MEIFSSYTGTDFLIFYAAMLATCVFLGLWIPAVLRPAGVRNHVEEIEEIAVLAGGMKRHVEAVSSDLLARDALAPGSKNKLRVVRSQVEAGAAGQSILRKPGNLSLRHLTNATKREAKRVETRLVRHGLVMEGAERLKLRFIAIIPYAALFAIGLYRYQAGSALGEPTGFLLALMVVTIVFAIFRFAKMNIRTTAGDAVLRKLEKEASRLKRAPSANEAGFAVALFGTGVLVGTPWEQVHAMRQAANGTGDSGSSGDGGCGGGGCGGCGG